MTATNTTNEASASPIAPRGVRTADQSTDVHGRLRAGRAGRGRAAGGAFTAMAYLAILRRGVASKAITSVTMFMTT
jgi:hypothetical protein